MKKERLSLVSFVLPAVLSFATAAAGSARAELLYVSLQTEVVSFDLSSGVGATIAATKTTVASGLTEAMGLVFGGDGNLYVANYGTGTAGTGTVRQYTLGTPTGTLFASGFTDTRGITYSSTGDTFYVANSGNPGSISQVTSGGSVSTYLTFGSNTSPYGLALDGTGALYSGNNASQTLSKIEGGVPSTFTSFSPLAGTRGVAVSTAGDIYTAVSTGVQKTTSGGSTSTFVAQGSMAFPFGLAFDSGGNLLVASLTDNAVFAYDSSGTQLYSFSTGAGTANRPRYVALNVPGSGFNAVPEPAMGITVVSIACAAILVRCRRQRPAYLREDDRSACAS